ncbi:RNA 3'-terminal phosphate cyclase [uncultured Methanobacterium sp.]|uniref:RNA 3'-terminal phosphate cyclase n=1 Tax=uncultured Methanobacterium sp. TaxID=176306 RepID=UPI002AA74410|nr:RNA 3'-terminal phosphate cyclase [uncultured Methanobacterium sp.]
MIKINGSFGEGGGALLRVSTALSEVTGKEFTISNIRSSRPKPGLMPQHLNSVKALAKLSSAEVTGLELGSTQITFTPGPLKGGKLEIDVKTAGSVTLILQALIIPSLFADQAVEIKIRGGTDVRWAPPFDYLEQVTLPVLQSMGIDINLELLQRGYYPRGGGILKARIEPVKKLKPLNLHDLEVDIIRGISHSTLLPSHVAIRQAQSAEKTLKKAGYEVDIQIKSDDDNNALGPGSGLVLWSEVENKNIPCVGASSLGKPGKKAEIVGTEAADEILSFLSRGAALDRYMGDQIIPYLALVGLSSPAGSSSPTGSSSSTGLSSFPGSSSVRVSELTQHTLTNIYAAEKFTDKKFQVNGSLGEITTITV